MRRTGRSALARGIATLAVMAAGIIVAATRGSSPVASAETVLGSFRDVTIVTAAGSVVHAESGLHLADGDVITTGPHGSAQLITRHRETLLAGNAALEVINGGRQQLRTGTAVVNSLHGPGLALDLSDDLVAIPHGSATEAARGPSTRVGALAGPATITSSIGRQLDLTPLSQAVLSGDALPAGTTPLHLTDSVAEDSVVPTLVRDDIALNALARGIDTTGRSTARVVEASWTGSTVPALNQVSRSERVLPVLIADSTHGGSAQQRYDDAVGWRAEGGSWGVVLHLLSGRSAAVEATLAALQKHGQAPGQIGTVAPSGTGITATGIPPRVFANPPVNHGVSTHRGSGTKPSGHHPAPPPPDNLLGGLVSTVQSVITSVFGILPHDPTTTTTKPSSATKTVTSLARKTQTGTSSTSTATKPTRSVKAKRVAVPKAKPKPAATPTPATKPSNGLVGNLLGGLLG
ncbi:MAG: hypothetical protein ACTHK4_09575 [Mycobacteriales bacterium]